MKLLFYNFEQLSGLKINFHKSKIFCFGEAKEFEDQYMGLLGCNTGAFPMRYLGIPIHYKKLSNADWLKVQERFEKRLMTGTSRLVRREAQQIHYAENRTAH